jgi:cysteinyl-tRNA synthetase
MKVFNTLTGKKEEFQPLADTVTMYVCGVTVYDECHIGHAMSYVVFDMIKRYLIFRGYRVKHVQNFTDIDDKVINRARELKLDPSNLAARYIQEYFLDMDALNIQRADVYPRATREVSRVIDMVRVLLDKAHAYVSDGSVYFRVRSFPDYGKLSHRSLDEMASRSGEYEEKKQDPLDFAVWKAAKPGEPAWESPWGPGRPGWHMECSAMSLKYLGDSIDIHGGGQDLVFPHHENEIAQSESYTGVAPFARYWLHNGLLQQFDEKMSKSTGNIVRVKEVLGRFSPDAVRLFMLGSHYRSPLVYSEEALAAAERADERLRIALHERSPSLSGTLVDPTPFEQRFTSVMDDDFNTPQALAVLFDLARCINRGASEGANMTTAQRTLQRLAEVLGLKLEEPAQAASNPESLIQLLVSVRDELRRGRQWALADWIRNEMSQLGIVLEDTSEGTGWRYKGQP